MHGSANTYLGYHLKQTTVLLCLGTMVVATGGDGNGKEWYGEDGKEAHYSMIFIEQEFIQFARNWIGIVIGTAMAHNNACAFF